jgi:hypothetical protein
MKLLTSNGLKIQSEFIKIMFEYRLIVAYCISFKLFVFVVCCFVFLFVFCFVFVCLFLFFTLLDLFVFVYFICKFTRTRETNYIEINFPTNLFPPLYLCSTMVNFLHCSNIIFHNITLLNSPL